jgi:hypothetical protein
MAQRNPGKERIELASIPREMVAAVLVAQMYQVQADAANHPDPDARERIITAASLVLETLKGYVTPEVVAAIPQIQAIFTGRQ